MLVQIKDRVLKSIEVFLKFDDGTTKIANLKINDFEKITYLKGDNLITVEGRVSNLVTNTTTGENIVEMDLSEKYGSQKVRFNVNQIRDIHTNYNGYNGISYNFLIPQPKKIALIRIKYEDVIKVYIFFKMPELLDPNVVNNILDRTTAGGDKNGSIFLDLALNIDPKGKYGAANKYAVNYITEEGETEVVAGNIPGATPPIPPLNPPYDPFPYMSTPDRPIPFIPMGTETADIQSDNKTKTAKVPFYAFKVLYRLDKDGEWLDGATLPTDFKGGWRVSTAVLNTARRLLAGCGTSEVALAIGGFNGSYLNTVELFNGSIWVAHRNMNVNRSSLGACGNTNAALAFNGIAGSVGLRTTEIFDGAQWRNGADSVNGKYLNAGCGVSNAALAFGGGPINAPALHQTEKYNGTTWATGNNLNTSRSGLAGCGSTTAALAISGCETNRTHTSSELYNGITWSINGDLISGRYYLAGCGNSSSALAFGGNTRLDILATTDKYNNGVWSIANNMNAPISALACAGNVDKAVSFGGGESAITGATEVYINSTENITLRDQLDNALDRVISDSDLLYTGYSHFFKFETPETGRIDTYRIDLFKDTGLIGTEYVSLHYINVEDVDPDPELGSDDPSATETSEEEFLAMLDELKLLSVVTSEGMIITDENNNILLW